MRTEARRAWHRALAASVLSGTGVLMFAVFVGWSWRTQVLPCGGELLVVPSAPGWASWPIVTAQGVAPFDLRGRDLHSPDLRGGHDDIALHDPALCPRSDVALDISRVTAAPVVADEPDYGRSTQSFSIRHDGASDTYAVVGTGATPDGVLIAAFRRAAVPRRDFATDVAAMTFWAEATGLLAAAIVFVFAAKRLRRGWRVLGPAGPFSFRAGELHRNGLIAFEDGSPPVALACEGVPPGAVLVGPTLGTVGAGADGARGWSYRAIATVDGSSVLACTREELAREAVKSAWQCAKTALAPLWVLAGTMGAVGAATLLFALLTVDCSDM